MENASKALLIAGAILIAILLIGIGMLVFNGIGGITDQSQQQVDAMEIQMFNSRFTQYEGKNVSGSNVKALINAVNANNKTYAGDTSRQVKVTAPGNTADTTTPVTTQIGSNYRYTVVCSSTGGGGYIDKIVITKNP